MSYVNTACTVTLQRIVNILKTMPLLRPVVDVVGSEDEPALSAANDVMNAICGCAFPHKWNEMIIPVFYSNSNQQDYAGIYPNGASITNLSWLERGIVIDINNNSSPKPYCMVEVGRELPQATASWFSSNTLNYQFRVNYFPNNTLYYGTWGAGQVGNATFGNNPGPGSVYTNPVGVVVTSASWAATSGGQITFTLNYIPNGMAGGQSLQIANAAPAGYNGSFIIVSVTPSTNTVVVTATTNPGTFQAGGNANNTGGQSQPSNPITQIQDANGNYLVLTQYGTEGTTAPVAPTNSAAGVTCFGTGATTVWTVVDPYGQGFRVFPVPSQTGNVWEFNLVGQMLPIRFTQLNTLLAPLPDQFEPNFRQGMVAQLYRYSPNEKVRANAEREWLKWLNSLVELRAKQDREKEENRFTVRRGIMSRGGGYGGSWYGPVWPFAGPGPGTGF